MASDSRNADFERHDVNSFPIKLTIITQADKLVLQIGAKMGNIVFGAIMPHPPILIPEIGKNRLKEAEKSKRALEQIAQKLKTKNFETLIVITPHGEVGYSSVPVYTSHVFEGDFGAFGASKLSFTFKGDSALGLAIVKECDYASSCPETVLDHGVLVPLYYPQSNLGKKLILPIAISFLPLPKLFSFGQVLAKTIKKSNKNVAIIASADMSHRLTPDAPSGYSPKGKEFDDKLVQLVKDYDVKGIINFDTELAEAAGQDALWSIAMLLGALDGQNVKPEVLSYEGPFGVGYMVASFEVNN
jgi:AmmeMemoRadiSam system protein B